MDVQQDEDRMTAMGRLASHISVDLNPSTEEPDDYHCDEVTQVADEDEETVGTNVTIQVPEKLNLICNLEEGGCISVQGKIEGNTQLSTTDGDIRVKKLRGHQIDLRTRQTNNVIYATDLIEAEQLNVETPGRFRAKQVHGSTVNVTIENEASNQETPVEGEEADDEGSLVDISALFVSGQGGATLEVNGSTLKRRAIRVKSHHGPLQANARGVSIPSEKDEHKNEIYPIIELGGVNGQCEVSIMDTQSTPLAGNNNKDWSSCLVHLDSLSPETVSVVEVDQGDVTVTVDRKVEADMRLVSMATGDALAETGALLADEEDDDMVVNVLRHLDISDGSPSMVPSQQRISVETKAFTAKPTGFQSPAVEYVEGFVENNSAEPDSRFERKVRGDTGSIGKIRLDGAADQALKGFSRGESSSTEEDTESETFRPLLAVVGTRAITVETVSWLGAIARRYGLEESDRKMGRTAARRGRSFAPVDTDDPQ